MSMETRDLASPTPNAQRPLPPEIDFEVGSGTFFGTAEPGKIVKLTTTADEHTRKTTVKADGKWEIVLGHPPRWYTTFHLWVSDPVTEATSHTTRYTYGGTRVRLEDVYASKSVAFGRARAGTEITVFGPGGQTLGRSFVFGENGAWIVRFRETLESGEKVCVVAARLDGSTSLPQFIRAENFSVDDRNVGFVAGSGAGGGESITLTDIATDRQVAETVATGAGIWSARFDAPLEVGTRLGIERFHKDGSSSKGPIVTVTARNCPAPTIEGVSSSTVLGTARPGQLVRYARYRDLVQVATHSLVTPASGNWSVTETDLRERDSIVATTADDSGEMASQLYASLTVGTMRPGLPHMSSTNADGASGYANPGDYIIASTETDGIVAWCKVQDDGAWALQWEPLADRSGESPLVQFTVYTDLTGAGCGTPSSHSAARYANDASTAPATPSILSWTSGSATFTGTEATTNTTLKVFNYSQNKHTVSTNPANVTSQNWSLVADISPPMEGDLVYAIATGTMASGDPGATSDPSSPLFLCL